MLSLLSIYLGVYSLSSVETASVWHIPSAQRVGQFGDIRERMGVDYLVDCWDFPGTLCLLAGTYGGRGLLLSLQVRVAVIFLVFFTI